MSRTLWALWSAGNVTLALMPLPAPTPYGDAVCWGFAVFGALMSLRAEAAAPWPDIKEIHDTLAGCLGRTGLTYSGIRDAAKEVQKLYAATLPSQAGNKPQCEAVADIATAEKMLSEHIEEFHDFDYQPHEVPLELSSLRAIQHHLLGSMMPEPAGASSPPMQADLWQDIATAPKDGTPILAANSRHDSHAPVVVRWDGNDRDGADPHWCDAATREGCALYFNPNYFDLWRPVPLVSRDKSGDSA